MSYVTSNPGNAEEDAPLVQEGHEEEIFAPKVSLSQIVLGTHMRCLNHCEQELVLAMMAGQMAIVETRDGHASILVPYLPSQICCAAWRKQFIIVLLHMFCRYCHYPVC